MEAHYELAKEAVRLTFRRRRVDDDPDGLSASFRKMAARWSKQELEDADVAKDFCATRRRTGITGGRFVQDELRHARDQSNR